MSRKKGTGSNLIINALEAEDKRREAEAKIRKERNDELIEASGNVRVNSRLVSFLYILMRDRVPTTIVEQALLDSEDSYCQYSNGFLALYALNVARRLVKKSNKRKK